MARKGLGKGLDSLIPNFYDEDFDSNSTQSLEDILNDNNEESDEKTDEVIETDEVTIENNESIVENNEESNDVEEEVEDNQEDEDESVEQQKDQQEVSNEQKEEETPEENSPSEDIPGDSHSEEVAQTSQEIQIQEEHVEEVKAIVDKNPRITLWSSRSSAVFRYLRKTEPEFSISKEASVLIEEAVAKKYPEIWALFEDV